MAHRSFDVDIRQPAWLRGNGLLSAVLALLVTGAVLTGCGKSSASSIGSSLTSKSTASASSVSASPGTCPTSNTTAFAKAKFVLHTGLAFGTFHRYIYDPYKAGMFNKGAHGRLAAFVKAGATALFDEHELRLATTDVKANPTLCKVLAAPLEKLGAGLTGAVSKLKSGDSSGITGANSQIAGISGSSAAGGAPITERTDESAG